MAQPTAMTTNAPIELKILFVGNCGVGKTSIIKKWVHNIFSTHYASTQQVDFAHKVVTWRGRTVKLSLWDLAGQDRTVNLTKVYYKEAAAAVVMYDKTRIRTFEGVQNWKKDIDEKVMLPNLKPLPVLHLKPLPVLLVGNKNDLPADEGDFKVDEGMQKAYAEQNGYVGHFFTSAQNNDDRNIDLAMDYLLDKIFEACPEYLEAPVAAPAAVASTPLVREERGCSC